MNLLRLPANVKGRDFVVGDLHGCRYDLFECMNRADFDDDVDRVFSVGDLIDRGPDSIGCLELLNEPWFFAVRGNHEQLMIESETPSTYMCWMSNGGEWAAKVQRWKEFLPIVRDLPLVIHIENHFNVLHAEFLGNDEQLLSGEYNTRCIDEMQWGRTLISEHRRGEKWTPELKTRTYVGHTPVADVTTIGAIHYIDTGACFNQGHLTFLEVPK